MEIGILYIATSFPGHFPCLEIGEIALGSAGHVIPKYPDFVGISNYTKLISWVCQITTKPTNRIFFAEILIGVSLFQP